MSHEQHQRHRSTSRMQLTCRQIVGTTDGVIWISDAESGGNVVIELPQRRQLFHLDQRPITPKSRERHKDSKKRNECTDFANSDFYETSE